MSTRRLLWGLVSWILISSLYVAARQSGETIPGVAFLLVTARQASHRSTLPPISRPLIKPVEYLFDSPEHLRNCPKCFICERFP